MNHVIAVLLIIIAIPFLLALFIGKKYLIQKEILINKPASYVYEYLEHLNNQEQYSKWVMTDPDKRVVKTGTDGTEGFIYAWDSDNKNVGKGEQEIKKLTINKRIDCEIRFEKPFKNIAETFMITESLTETQTKVKWGMLGRNNYPMNLMNLFISKMLGKDLENKSSYFKKQS